MNLPDSIQKITQDGPSDAFLAVSKPVALDVDQLIFNIKSTLGSKEARFFEQGRAFYKIAGNEKTFVRNLLRLYIEIIVTKIKESDIDSDNKRILIKNFDNTCNSIISIFDTQIEMLKTFNKEKNIIDVLEISYIMAGYAIETIKKIYSIKA